jgi:transglutaminase-like putative cysteine protease
MSIRVMSSAVGVLVVGLSVGVEGAWGLERRAIEFTYGCEVIDVPAGASRIDLWMPVPKDGMGQKVHRVEVILPADGTIATEKEYDNRIFHKRFEGPFKKGDALSAEMVFEVTQEEIVVDAAKSLIRVQQVKAPAAMKPYLSPDAMIPIGGRIVDIANGLKLPKDDALRTARTFYDYLIDEFKYNWMAEGAGKGNVLWACDSKTGDCTDYHSMFLALCRSRGIPATHEFGFKIPPKEGVAKLKYYHCWAWFWVEKVGWIPVDVSEADKHPELREYNFGSLTANLLRMVHGRDLILEPAQQAGPVNIFGYPYAEVDGKPHQGLKWTASYRDLEAK